jgi:hypothetical protein
MSSLARARPRKLVRSNQENQNSSLLSSFSLRVTSYDPLHHVANQRRNDSVQPRQRQQRRTLLLLLLLFFLCTTPLTAFLPFRRLQPTSCTYKYSTSCLQETTTLLSDGTLTTETFTDRYFSVIPALVTRSLSATTGHTPRAFNKKPWMPCCCKRQKMRWCKPKRAVARRSVTFCPFWLK